MTNTLALFSGQFISSFSLPDNLKMVGIIMSEVANLESSDWKFYLSMLASYRYCTKEGRWDETAFGVQQWRAACVIKYWVIGAIAHMACHCLTPNAVSSHLLSFERIIYGKRWRIFIALSGSLPVKFHTILHIDRDSLKILQSSLYCGAFFVSTCLLLTFFHFSHFFGILDDVMRRFCSMCKHYMNCVAAVDLSKRSKVC